MGRKFKYSYRQGTRTWHFRDLADLLARATPPGPETGWRESLPNPMRKGP